jgi:hypothetical protein
MNTLPNWRQGITPHQDIQANQVSEALFAVNLSRAIAQQGTDEYRDPTTFFERTHLTRTLKSLMRDVLMTLNGQPGSNSVIHLQTNFGGGKTHAELALYHLLNTPAQATAVSRVAQLLDEGSLTIPSQATVVPLPCADLYPGGEKVEEDLTVNTLWGLIAYKLGGQDLYQLIRDSDERRIAPGVALLRELLDKAGPNLILIDEMLHYVDKAAAITIGDSNLANQTLGFLRELTEAVDVVDHSVLVASLTASRMEDLEVLGEEQAQFTLSKMEDIMRRLEDARTPIESSEIYDITRARLMQSVNSETAQAVAAVYAQFYKSDPWKELLPTESRDPDYIHLLAKAYPFHPSIVKVLYERWGSRPAFQLTRGTLRFLSHLLAYLWHNNGDGKAVNPLIQLADIDLNAEKVRAEAIQVAGSEWESVIGTDIAASQEEAAALAQRLDRKRGGLYARYGLIQGIATSVFMFTHGGEQRRPTPRKDLRLAAASPDIPLSDLNQAFDDCRARLYYYYEEEGGLIFKTEPNPNKVLADARADVQTDDARTQVERVVEDVLGHSTLFHVTYYGFQGKLAQETADVPDDEGRLELVVLPPKHATRGKVSGKTAELIADISHNYGKRLRFNRNMLLFLVPDSEFISGAIDRAMDWLAANAVLGDSGLMSRFSDEQKEEIRGRATTATNDTKDHVRKAYNTVLIPNGPGSHEQYELSYVPSGRNVFDQLEEELTSRRKLHQEFNPALFADRWESLWPKTATVITTQGLWQKFARNGENPILTGIQVLQDTIRQGVERELFGYGIMHDSDSDKLQPDSYARVYLDPFDAQELEIVEISQRTVLLRPEQVYALFPPMTKEEVAMLLHSSRQRVDAVFHQARRSLTVQGRVDKRSFITAVCDGVQAGLFGYAETADSPILRGEDAGLTPGQVRFSGLLIGEDVPRPITAEEIARLLPGNGRVSVETLYQQAADQFGPERVSEQSFLNALQAFLKEQQFGYAETESDSLQPGLHALHLSGFVGKPELPPPDTRVIRIVGTITSASELPTVMKAAMNLSRLGDSQITIDLRLELKGDVNEHSVMMALNELKSRAPNLQIEEVKGK